MKQPIWVYKTLIFGIFGIIMLAKVVVDFPRINYLFLFGGLCFGFVFLVGMFKINKQLNNLYSGRKNG